MFQMPRYTERVSLIPGGCPQLMDFEANLASLPRIRRCFAEVPRQTNGTSEVRLVPLREENGRLMDDVTGDPVSAESYEVDGRKSLAPWLGQWIPVPFLREREQLWERDGECRVERGPSNWARVRMVEDSSRPEMLRIVLAFDMQVEEPSPETGRYAALAPGDINAHAQFRLASHVRDNAWFLNEPWIDQWLRDVWDEYLRANHKRRPEDAPKLEYLASYLSMLDVLNICIRGVKVYVINPERHTPVDVDLVLDIGNSRTTGMLVETRAQSVTNLNDSYLLQLRDMDQPENVYTDPFETRVEFSEIHFGNDALSRRSGRLTAAFSWPSPVRIGPEAARLSTFSICAEGATGMSSPKRYLWDERDWQQSWRFNTRGAGEPYVTRGLLAQNVNASGTPLCCMDDPLFTRNKILRRQEKESAFESLFTRSSLMMFLLVEVIQQALLTINSPGQRGRRDASDLPRRLRQVIFTVPAGMPIAEQRIYRRWAKWAVRVLWETLGWEAFYSSVQNRKPARADYRTSPIVRCDWDEATCTQLVYVYNEVTRKYQGDARLLCSLVGRPRPEYDSRPCVRVATIDIGGGTTDLSITTFDLQSDEGSSARMAPHPEFRDGVNIAGDDVLAAVVREHILPAIGEAIIHAGIHDSRAALAHLFGRDVMDNSAESRNARIQFVRQAAVPVALGLLALYEQAGPRASGASTHLFRDFFHQSPQEGSLSGDPLPESLLHNLPNEAALNYVASYVRTQTGEDFSLLDVPVKID
ncbi:MAG: virulence factor SrfB, partial [Desulfovibrionaceae bacterium]|nr:virulence factor SrfB [Desulfovibrionaceae bacterium]